MNTFAVGRVLWTTMNTSGTLWSWLEASSYDEFLASLGVSLIVSTIVTLFWFCLEANLLLQYDGRHDQRELIRR